MASWAWSRAGAAPRSAHRAASPHCAHGLSAVPLQLLSGAEDSFVHVWKLSRSPDTDDVEVSETREQQGSRAGSPRAAAVLLAPRLGAVGLHVLQ